MNAEIHYPEVEILNKLNEITGSRFREIKSNLSKIKALLKAGFTEVEIIEVIQLKTLQWKVCRFYNLNFLCHVVIYFASILSLFSLVKDTLVTFCPSYSKFFLISMRNSKMTRWKM